MLARCWSHWRRKFVEIDRAGPAPIAHAALERIAALYPRPQRRGTARRPPPRPRH